MGPLEQFAENLRSAREARGLSQEALGLSCDVHRTEISLLEICKREPRLATIAKVAWGLQMTPSELLEGVVHEPPQR